MIASLAGKRLIIFGCGYVGSAVALQAREHGMRVTALTRNSASAQVLREQDIEAVVADLAENSWHAEIAGGADFALNCVSSGGGTAESYRRSYLEGMTSIVKWAQERGAPQTLVYTSSTSVYPQGGGAFVDESAPTPRNDVSERAKILLEAEDCLRANGNSSAWRWFILRLAGIYGPGRHHFVDQVRAGEVHGTPDTHLNLIHRDDIVSAIWACFLATADVRNEVFNAVDNVPATKSEVVTWLAELLRVPVPRLTGQAISDRRGLTPDRIILNQKLRSLLGWQPRYPSFREGCANFLSP